eukprot:8947068-Alexandrium_andersonii.AAC.1
MRSERVGASRHKSPRAPAPPMSPGSSENSGLRAFGVQGTRNSKLWGFRVLGTPNRRIPES